VGLRETGAHCRGRLLRLEAGVFRGILSERGCIQATQQLYIGMYLQTYIHKEHSCAWSWRHRRQMPFQEIIGASGKWDGGKINPFLLLALDGLSTEAWRTRRHILGEVPFHLLFRPLSLTLSGDLSSDQSICAKRTESHRRPLGPRWTFAWAPRNALQAYISVRMCSPRGCVMADRA
jgi:hypothetical protein